MIPGSFEYHRPAALGEAVGLLASLGDDARVLAGGHSLIPMMKLRMAAVEHLVDLQDIAELAEIEVGPDRVTIGAMVTQDRLISHVGLAKALPILREAALQIADPQVRYVGTVGGNVANGDPGNDMPGLMQCLDATYTVEGTSGARLIKARDFYRGAYDTARDDAEILTRISIPVPPARTGYAYEKQKRKIGDYATAAAAVTIGAGQGAGQGAVQASVAMTNLGDGPVWSPEAGAALAAGDVEAAVEAVLAAIEPGEDMRGPVEFKRHVAGVILRRAIARAQERSTPVAA
ncbi:MAG: xanthine dehydrogenase family protein subunit M [Pseudomonadota bacterium]